ncbi:MAG TPA: rhodanese-like domain-containing protein [Chthoniobacterales bacterium]|nr:rhodanese-like domain-containing protein [Chthoniobacterales bacterium]
MKKIFAVLSAFALAATAFAATTFPDISLHDLKKVVAAKDATIVDVNGSDSFKEGHIPGAIDYIAIKDDFAAKLPSDKNALIVAYCGSPSCKAYLQAAIAAEKLGYTNVKHFAGGISGWKDAGEPTQKAD